MTIVLPLLLALGAVVVIGLLVPFLMPVMEPLFRSFDRYCDWVERRL